MIFDIENKGAVKNCAPFNDNNYEFLKYSSMGVPFI